MSDIDPKLPDHELRERLKQVIRQAEAGTPPPAREEHPAESAEAPEIPEEATLGDLLQAFSLHSQIFNNNLLMMQKHADEFREIEAAIRREVSQMKVHPKPEPVAIPEPIAKTNPDWHRWIVSLSVAFGLAAVVGGISIARALVAIRESAQADYEQKVSALEMASVENSLTLRRLSDMNVHLLLRRDPQSDGYYLVFRNVSSLETAGESADGLNIRFWRR